jgi:hypothetical protein
MALFDSYSQGSFKRLRDGRIAFYPNIVGRGYVVSDEQRAVLQRYTSRGLTYVVALMAFASFFGAVFIILLGLAFSAGYYLWLWQLTRNLERTPAEERLTLSGRYRTQAQHLAWTTLWSLEIVCGLFTVAGLYLATTRRDSYSVSVGLVTIAFFGFGSWAGAYMLWVKRNTNETSD